MLRTLPMPLASTGPARLDFGTRELFKTYIHEAAHAVAARKNGIPVPWVSVDRDFIRNNPLAIENECNHGMGVCMTLNSHMLAPILTQRRIITKADKQTIMNYGVQVMAGPFAEQSFDPATFDAGMAKSDGLQVGSVLAQLITSIAGRKRFFVDINRAARKFVLIHRPTIVRVAQGLQDHRTLYEHEIDALIEESREATTAKQLN